MKSKDRRKVFRNLLIGPLADLVPESAIKNGRPADFYGALKVICVYSMGTDWKFVARKQSNRSRLIIADIFVKYADEDLNWSESDAEDAIDDISDRILDVVDDNQETEAWAGLNIEDRTQTGDTVDVNGTEYRRETIIIKPV